MVTAPKPQEIKLNGASVLKGWWLLEAINIPVVNRWIDMPGNYGGHAIEFGNIFNWSNTRRKHNFVISKRGAATEKTHTPNIGILL